MFLVVSLQLVNWGVVCHKSSPQMTFLLSYILSFHVSGDEIFSVNGQSVAGLTHSEAIGIFKETKVGPIHVTIGRREASKKVEFHFIL